MEKEGPRDGKLEGRKVKEKKECRTEREKKKPRSTKSTFIGSVSSD